MGVADRVPAAAAGIKKRITAHSGRIGLAVELTLRGASTHDIMRAGHWKTAAMVAHYSAAARAEKGAVSRYMAPITRLARAHSSIVLPDMTLNALTPSSEPSVPRHAWLAQTRCAGIGKAYA